MRIILYMLDGLTPSMIQSLNDKKSKRINGFAPFNYIDSLAKDSFIIKNCYGYGETMGSLTAMVSGMDLRSLKTDMPMHPDSYHKWPKIVDYLKKCGFLTVFYQNISQGLRKEGAYKRYYSFIEHGYDHVCLEDKTLPLQESKFIQKKDDFFFLKSEKPVYIFIHDLNLHDHSLVQKHGTKEGLAKAIVESGEQVRKNLKYLNYKKESDVLIFCSDHGMTLGPYDDLFFDKNISETTIGRYWPKLTSDFKLKICFFIKGPDILPGYTDGIFEIRDMFSTILDFLHIKYAPTGAISAKSHTRTSVLTSTFGSNFERLEWKSLDHWFHPYIVYVKNSKKWVYKKSNKKGCFYIDLKKDQDEDNPITIPFSKFPLEFKKYIREYFSVGRTLYRLLYAYSFKIIDYFFNNI